MQVLPQELIHEILSYVPEYGHRINRELHESSLDAPKVSAYCDLYRYCARSILDRFDTVVSACNTESLKSSAMNYLKQNLREVLCRHLDYPSTISKELLLQLGLNNAMQITTMETCTWTLFKNHEYRKRVIRLYSLMIFRENGSVSKKEFVRQCAEFHDIVILLEIIFAAFALFSHIFNISMRYFDHMLDPVLERMNRRAAVTDDIVFTDDYYDDSERIMKIRSLPRITINNAGNTDYAVLRNARDQLLGDFERCSDWEWHGYYDSDDKFKKGVYRIITMVMSMADE